MSVKEKTSLLKKAINYITKHKLRDELWNYCNNDISNEKIIEFYYMKAGDENGKKIEIQ